MRNPADSRWYEIRWSILERDQFTCRYCGQFAPNVVLHIDHVVAVCEGGTDDPGNLVTACSACNIGKEMYRAETTRQRQRGVSRSSRAFPLTSTSILDALADAPDGLTVMQVAERLDRDRTSVVKPLNRLVEAGVASVTRTRGSNGRAIKYVYRLADAVTAP